MWQKRMDPTVKLGSVGRHGRFLASAFSGGCWGSRTGIRLSFYLPRQNDVHVHVPRAHTNILLGWGYLSGGISQGLTPLR